MSYKIVVARYNESIDWLNNEMKNCIIYNKGNPLNINNEVILKNVGRESETYLHFIITNYKNLPDVIVFTQARISDHRGKDDINYLIQIKNEALNNSKSLDYIVHHETDTHDFCWDKEWNLINGQYYLTNNYKNNKHITFIEWFKYNININYPNPIKIYPNGIFAVKKENILNKPITYYKKLISEVNHHINSTEGHFFERSWYYIFDIPIHLITFNTQGNPYDNGMNLTDTSNIFESIFKDKVDFFTSFNSEKMINIYPNFKEEFLKVYSEYNYGEHKRGCNMGFWSWKPFVIHNYLKQMNDGDILVYHDCNIVRYPFFQLDSNNFKDNVKSLFNSSLDVIIPFENPYNDDLRCKNYVKNELFKKVGKENDYYKNFPLLHANRIFIRKSKLSENFILNWLKLCKTDLILPEINENIKWHTHDQAIVTVLYRKYIEMGFFDENSPNLYIKNDLFTKNNILRIN
jgi:hypothetical protein